MDPLQKKLNRLHLTAAALALTILLMLVVSLPAYGQTSDSTSSEVTVSVSSLESQANALRTEIDSLNVDLEKLVEQHNATRTELEQLTAELADSRRQLDDMTAQHNAQEKLVSDRLSAMYKAGEISFVSILLNSRSLDDFFEQALYVTKITEQDAKLGRQYKSNADAIRKLTDEIDQKRSRQLNLVRDLDQQTGSVQAKIIERQQRLDQVDGQVRQILEAEAARQRAEQARIAAEQAALLQQLGITDGIQAQVVQTSLQYLGVPYVWGGESPAGFDCSGLTKYVYAQHGVRLPHNAAMQFNLGVPIPREGLQPGDLIFWGPGSPHHVGMYIGNGKFIEAPNFGEVVKISTLTFDSDYAGARRFPLRARGTSPA